MPGYLKPVSVSQAREAREGLVGKLHRPSNGLLGNSAGKLLKVILRQSWQLGVKMAIVKSSWVHLELLTHSCSFLPYKHSLMN